MIFCFLFVVFLWNVVKEKVFRRRAANPVPGGCNSPQAAGRSMFPFRVLPPPFTNQILNDNDSGFAEPNFSEIFVWLIYFVLFHLLVKLCSSVCYWWFVLVIIVLFRLFWSLFYFSTGDNFVQIKHRCMGVTKCVQIYSLDFVGMRFLRYQHFYGLAT